MNYEEWVVTVAVEIKADSLWKMTAYRLALFLGDLGGVNRPNWCESGE